MSSFIPCEIDDAIQYTNLGYRAQVPEIVILKIINNWKISVKLEKKEE